MASMTTQITEIEAAAETLYNAINNDLIGQFESGALTTEEEAMKIGKSFTEAFSAACMEAGKHDFLEVFRTKMSGIPINSSSSLGSSPFTKTAADLFLLLFSLTSVDKLAVDNICERAQEDETTDEHIMVTFQALFSELVKSVNIETFEPSQGRQSIDENFRLKNKELLTKKNGENVYDKITIDNILEAGGALFEVVLENAVLSDPDADDEEVQDAIMAAGQAWCVSIFKVFEQTSLELFQILLDGKFEEEGDDDSASLYNLFSSTFEQRCSAVVCKK